MIFSWISIFGVLRQMAPHILVMVGQKFAMVGQETVIMVGQMPTLGYATGTFYFVSQSDDPPQAYKYR